MHWATVLAVALFGMLAASPYEAMGYAPDTPTVDFSVVNGEGKPVPNAIVRLLDGESAESSGRSDAAGMARVPRPIPADLPSIPVIASDAEGTNQGYLEWLFRDPDVARKPLRIELSPAAEVLVQVTDSTGAPVAEALVAALTFKADVLAHGRTDATGALRLRFPAKAEPHSMIALKPGAGFDNWLTDIFVDGQSWQHREVPPEMPLKLRRFPTVQVRAMDRLGNPLPGIAFCPRITGRRGGLHQYFTNCRLADAVTDERGLATFDWLPPESHCAFHARSESWAQNRRSVPSVNLSSSRPPVKPLDTSLHRRGTISGKITAADGTPAAGVVVLAEGIDDNGDSHLESARSGADGVYRISAAPGFVYLVGIDEQGFAAEIQQGIRIAEGNAAGNVDLQLFRGTLIHGTFHPEKKLPIDLKQVGSPVPRMRPAGVPLVPVLRRVTIPNAEGRYQFRVGPGQYHLGRGVASIKVTVTNEPEIVQDFPAELPARAEADQAARLARIGRGPLKPGTSPLSGSVVGADGKAVSRATIRGYHQDPGFGLQDPWTIESDESGRFQREVPRTTHWLFASSVDGKLVGWATAEPGSDPVELKLSPPARIVGRLVDGDRLLAGAEVELTLRRVFQPDGRTISQSFGFATVFADEQGRFSIPGVIVGESYSLTINDNPGSSSQRPGVRALHPERPGLFDLGYVNSPPQRQSMNDGVTWPHPDVLAQFVDRFDTKEDLATRIAAARADAARAGRRVLIVVGLPGTEATRSAFEVLEGLDEAEDFLVFYGKLEARHNKLPEPDDEFKRPLADFHRVYINARNDADAAHLSKAYRIDVSRVAPPILAIIGDEGRVVTQRWFGYADDSSRIDKQAVREFVQRQAMEPLDATELLASACRRAKETGKMVLLIQSSADSYPSRLLGRFVDQHRALLERDYVTLEIDSYRDRKGDTVIKRFRAPGDGLPWMTIIDAEGVKYADSNSAAGNIGFPSEPETIDFFIDEMLKPTAKRLAAEDLVTLRKALRGK